MDTAHAASPAVVYRIETYACYECCGDTDYDEDIDDELDFQSLLSTIQDGLSL